jgi:tetratricopeptide (TPR) repeat protein
LSRFDEALAAVETAEKRLGSFAAVSFDRAVVKLSKAIILQRVDRTPEAYDLIREARLVFADYGNARMLLIAGLIEAAHLYNDQRYSEAQDLFSGMLNVARELGDTESLARIENNLGYCATQAGNFKEANIHFSNGIAFFNDIGANLEATRAERGAGRVLIAKGQVNAGLGYLRNARNAFLTHQVNEEAALCGLEIVDVLVQRGDVEEGRSLAHEIGLEVDRAGLGEVASRALRRLEETLAMGGTEAAVDIRDVHAVLKSLHDQRETPAQ